MEPQKRKVRRPAAAEARWNAQRQSLLQAAQRAIHRAGPHISMDEIAAEAGITKPIFYRHFGDRRGLACALRDLSFGVLLGTPSDDPASDRRAARERIAALYPVVSEPEQLRRVVVGFASGFQMFVEMNRNLYRFLRAEGVMESIWDEAGGGLKEPVAESLAASLRAVFADRGVDATTADIWAHALRGMVHELVHWSTSAQVHDRFELERQIDLLAGALIDGLGRALAARRAAATARASVAGRQPRRAAAKTAKTAKAAQSAPPRRAAVAARKRRRARD